MSTKSQLPSTIPTVAIWELPAVLVTTKEGTIEAIVNFTCLQTVVSVSPTYALSAKPLNLTPDERPDEVFGISQRTSNVMDIVHIEWNTPNSAYS